MTQALHIPPLRILLADDNDANRLIARTILERSGHSVTTAVNGSHALSILKTAHFELVMLDIMMPVMDGMRALRRIRRDCPENANTPIFALTAYCSAEDRQRYRLAGFDAVLSKPLRPGDLASAFNQASTGQRSSQHESTRPALTDLGPLLDNSIIDHIRDAADAERSLQIQERFWASVDAQCEAMKKALPDALRGNGAFLSQFRRAVHAVKGASASIGLQRASAIAKQLQNAPPSDIPYLMRGLADALTESRKVLPTALSRETSNLGARELDITVQMRR